MDWEGSIDDRKSTSGASFFLGKCLVFCVCKEQSLWMKKIKKDAQVNCDQLISVFCDNTSTISISKNLVMHSKTNYIPTKYHFVRKQVDENSIKLEYVDTKVQIADIFTNPLPREAFEYLRNKPGIIYA